METDKIKALFLSLKKGQIRDIMLRLSFEYNSRAFLNYIDKENKWSELESELAKKNWYKL